MMGGALVEVVVQFLPGRLVLSNYASFVELNQLDRRKTAAIKLHNAAHQSTLMKRRMQ